MAALSDKGRHLHMKTTARDLGINATIMPGRRVGVMKQRRAKAFTLGGESKAIQKQTRQVSLLQRGCGLQLSGVIRPAVGHLPHAKRCVLFLGLVVVHGSQAVAQPRPSEWPLTFDMTLW